MRLVNSTPMVLKLEYINSMTFNMTSCKKGDKLILRNGKVVKYKAHLEPKNLGLHLAGNLVYYEEGTVALEHPSESDIVGFYKKDNSLSETDRRVHEF